MAKPLIGFNAEFKLGSKPNSQTRAVSLLSPPECEADLLELVKAIHRGFPFAALTRVEQETGWPLERLAACIGLSPRTLSRRKQEKRLSTTESDRLVTLSRLLTQAVELFEGQKAKAWHWFLQPNRALGNVSPLEMAHTETGSREVENLIGRLEHGVFS